MKKKNVNFKLGLNKHRISNLETGSVSGGTDVTQAHPCVAQSAYIQCEPGTSPVTDNSKTPTCAVGCTRATIELSYCNNGIPSPCLSIQVCA